MLCPKVCGAKTACVKCGRGTEEQTTGCTYGCRTLSGQCIHRFKATPMGQHQVGR